MSNMHRIIWFDQAVRMDKYPNARILAEQFEISGRQSQRDIDYLRNSLGAPLAYCPKNMGYYYENKSFILPQLYLTEKQREILGFLAYKYENYQNNATSTEVAELFRLLSNGEYHNMKLPVFELNEEAFKIIGQLNTALVRCKKVKAMCTLYEGKLLTLHPYKLYRKYGRDYLAAYCEDFEEEMVFRIDSLYRLEVLKLGFIVRAEYDERKYQAFISKSPFSAKVLFKEDPPSDVTDKYRKIDNLIYEIDFFDEEQFMLQLMVDGEWKEILSPRWLKEKMKKKLGEILEKL